MARLLTKRGSAVTTGDQALTTQKPVNNSPPPSKGKVVLGTSRPYQAQLHTHGMQACHSCNALQPIEGEHCTRCDAYLPRATAISGQPASYRAPVPRAVEPLAAPSFRFTPRKEKKWQAPRIPPVEWTRRTSGKPYANGNPRNSASALVQVADKSFLLRAAHRQWSVLSTIPHVSFRAHTLVERGEAVSLEDCMARAEEALVMHVSKG